MTLDDLRNPGFGGRMWGYDREQVDRLLVAVADAVEKLQRRRQRDAAAMEGLTREVTASTSRAVDADERLSALAGELAAAHHTAAEAHARAESAEQATAVALTQAQVAIRRSSTPVPMVRVEAASRASAEAMAVLNDLVGGEAPEGETLDEEAPPAHTVALAVRAARALVSEARARAAEIVADAEQRAGPPPLI